VVLISLQKLPIHTRVELDGVDISRRLNRIEVDADVHGGLTRVRLTVIDEVEIMGEAGVLEFVKRPWGKAEEVDES
jgi:hypothetical protein